MRKLSLFIILIVLLFNISCLAEELTCNEIINSKGIVYSILTLHNEVNEDKVDNNRYYIGKDKQKLINGIKADDKDNKIYLSLNRITLLDSDEEKYYVGIYYQNYDFTVKFIKIIEYNEIKDIIKLIKYIQDYANIESTIDLPNKIYRYISNDDILFTNGSLTNATKQLIIEFDNDNIFRVKESRKIDCILNFLENVDNMIEYNMYYK